MYRMMFHPTAGPGSQMTVESEVIARKIETPAARQGRRRCDADDRTNEDVERDRLPRSRPSEQRRRDHRRRPPSKHRCELKPDRRAAVAQARRKTLRGQRRKGSPHQVVEKIRDQGRQQDEPGYRGIEHGVIGEREKPGRHTTENINLLAADPIRQIAGERDREE